MNRTHAEHAIIAAIMAVAGLSLIYFTGATTAAIVMACLYPAVCFYFREQGQRTSILTRGRKISWQITIEASKFWHWSEDAYWDFIATIPVLILIGAVWSLW